MIHIKGVNVQNNFEVNSLPKAVFNVENTVGQIKLQNFMANRSDCNFTVKYLIDKPKLFLARLSI